MTECSLRPILEFVLAERHWPMTPALARLASALPPVPCAGLELPLSGAGSVDLQMRVRGRDEIERLRRFVGLAESRGDSWARVARFCEAGWPEGCEELWLELDDGADTLPAVSAFVRFARAPVAPAGVTTVGRMLEMFAYRASPEQQQSLDRCVEACHDGARISHVGLMLARPGAPLCIVIDDLPVDRPTAFLEEAGWPGCGPEVEGRLDALFQHVDRVRFMLTIGDAIHPALGLECFIGTPGGHEPRWGPAFDAFAAEGLCDPAVGDRILAWPSVLTPASVTGDWPGSLIAHAITRRAAELSWIECRLSHVKLTYEPGRPLRAKAYVGFLEVRRDFAASGDVSAPRAIVRPAGRDIHAAVQAALRFLVGARVQAGWWLDYDGFHEGTSDEWVTAYVAHAVHEAGGDNVDAGRAARLAWHRLAGRPRDGWGWNYVQPADADSTLWALRLAARLGVDDTPRAQAGRAFLRRHVGEDGGVATYLAEHHRQWSRGATINPSWCHVHTCVTAAAAACPAAGDTPRAALGGLQLADGSWASYWWESPMYATAHAVEALADRAPQNGGERVDRAAAFTASWLDGALAARDAAPAPFEVALALRTLLARPASYADRIAVAAATLLDGQIEDGSWAASAVLSIERADGTRVCATDQRRTFTTATVLRALHATRALTGRA